MPAREPKPEAAFSGESHEIRLQYHNGRCHPTERLVRPFAFDCARPSLSFEQVAQIFLRISES